MADTNRATLGGWYWHLGRAASASFEDLEKLSLSMKQKLPKGYCFFRRVRGEIGLVPKKKVVCLSECKHCDFVYSGNVCLNCQV